MRKCRPHGKALGVAGLILLSSVLDGFHLPSARAQSNSSISATSSQNPPAGETEKKRLAVNPLTGLVTSPGSDYRPLTAGESWKLYWKQNYTSIGAYVGPFAAALVLDQARGDPYQWGGGFPGYGRRLASRVGSAIVQGTFQAPAAALLKEDVRYIASNQRSPKRRVLHAVAYSFLTYSNHGHPTLNIANLGGYYVASATSTLWLPGSHRVVTYALSDASLQIALTIPVNMLQEFWPDIDRRVIHRH